MSGKKVNLESKSEVDDIFNLVEQDLDKTAPESLDVRVVGTVINNEVKNVATTTSADSAEARFLALAKIREDLVLQLKAINADLEKAMIDIGLDQMIQDPETLLVYKIHVPKGTFVSFRAIDYIRTKKDSEERGELSMKEAEAAGFVLGEKVSKAKKK